MEGKEKRTMLLHLKNTNAPVTMELTFDRIYRSWMKKLLAFVRKVSVERDKYLPEIEDKPEYSFFGTSEAVADQFFYFLMKDEMSSCTGNFTLDELDAYINDDCTLLERIENKNFMAKLCMFEFNGMLIGQIYDFYVSMWSCFEASINSLCVPLENAIQKKLNTSSFKKATKFFTQCMDNRIDKQEIIKVLNQNEQIYIKKFPQYVSFPDKINYLLNVLQMDYQRNPDEDKKILLYCGALRNTVHNNGVHLKSNHILTIHDHTFSLIKDEKPYYESFQDIMILVNEIFEIYVEIMRAWNIYSFRENKSEPPFSVSSESTPLNGDNLQI